MVFLRLDDREDEDYTCVCHFLCAYLISSLYLHVISSYIHCQDLIELNEERGSAVKLLHFLLFVLLTGAKKR